MACLKSQTNIYIQDMVVSPDMRNCDIGTNLLNTSKEYGILNNAEFLRTEVFQKTFLVYVFMKEMVLKK